MRVAVPEKLAGGVHLAFKSVGDGVNIPPAEEVQVPPVALPPTKPPRGSEMLPWPIGSIKGPMFIMGNVSTSTVLVSKIMAQPFVALSFKVAVPVYPADGVQVALGSWISEKVPPSGVDQVGYPFRETEAPNGAVVSPIQTAVTGSPIVTTGAMLTLMLAVLPETMGLLLILSERLVMVMVVLPMVFKIRDVKVPFPLSTTIRAVLSVEALGSLKS